MSKEKIQQNQIARKLIELNIPSNSAYILAILFEGIPWKAWNLAQELHLRSPQCYTALKWLKKKHWINSFQINCGKKCRPKKAYFLNKDPECILYEICDQLTSPSYLEGGNALLDVVFYLSRRKKVSTGCISDTLQISRYALRRILIELKERQWIKETRPLNKRKNQSFCQLLVSNDVIDEYYDNQRQDK